MALTSRVSTPGRNASGRKPDAWAAVGLAISLALSACVPPPAPPAQANRGANTIPQTPLAEYRLSPGDEVEITFANTPEFNSHQIVRTDGAISLQGLRPPAPVEIVAANLTIRELNRYLIDAYASELRNPQISVTLKAYGANVVYVMGEVGRPGAVAFSGSMSALQAIAAAEGPKTTARLNQVLVVRRDRNGQTSWRELNIGRAIAQADFRDDAPLQPRDLIYVPRSTIGNVGEFVDLYIRKILPIQPGFSLTTK